MGNSKDNVLGFNSVNNPQRAIYYKNKYKKLPDTLQRILQSKNRPTKFVQTPNKYQANSPRKFHQVQIEALARDLLEKDLIPKAIIEDLLATITKINEDQWYFVEIHLNGIAKSGQSDENKTVYIRELLKKIQVNQPE